MKFVFCCFLVLLLNGSAKLSADQITLRNGDRVSGQVLKKDGDTLTIESEHFGSVTVRWEEIATVTTDQEVHVELVDGRTIEGTLTTAANRVEITGPDARQSIVASNVVAIRNDAEQLNYERLLRPGWLDLWAGTANFGWAGAAGNAQTLTFTTGLKASRPTSADETSIYFNAIKASALVEGENSGTAEAVRGGWAYSRNVASRQFVNFFNDYEYDRFQSLDLRFVAGSGIGFRLWRGERGKFDVLGGMAYSREAFSTPLTRNSAEAYWGNELNLPLNTIITITQSYRMFNNVTETGDYRINFDVGATNRLTEWLSWNVSLNDRYLNNPAAGRKRNDFLYTTSLGFRFAR